MCCTDCDGFSVDSRFITVNINETCFLFIIVLSYLTCQLSLDTCVPAEVLFMCVTFACSLMCAMSLNCTYFICNTLWWLELIT